MLEIRSTGEQTHFAPAQTSHSRTGGGVAALRRSGVWKSEDESWRRTGTVHSVNPDWSRASPPDRGGRAPGYSDGPRGVAVGSLVGVWLAARRGGPPHMVLARARARPTCAQEEMMSRAVLHAARGSRPAVPGRGATAPNCVGPTSCLSPRAAATRI